MAAQTVIRLALDEGGDVALELDVFVGDGFGRSCADSSKK
jgi:hypothetical protein